MSSPHLGAVFCPYGDMGQGLEPFSIVTTVACCWQLASKCQGCYYPIMQKATSITEVTWPQRSIMPWWRNRFRLLSCMDRIFSTYFPSLFLGFLSPRLFSFSLICCPSHHEPSKFRLSPWLILLSGLPTANVMLIK